MQKTLSHGARTGYILKTQPTPEKTLIRAWEICRQKLDFVYVGNMSAGDMENTYCPSCKSLLVERTGYEVRIKPMLKKVGEAANCGKCGAEINTMMNDEFNVICDGEKSSCFSKKVFKSA